MKALKYSLPVWLYLALVCLAWVDAVPYYFLLLVGLSNLNALLGEFGEMELRQELKFFYRDRFMQQVKKTSALIFAGFNAGLFYLIANRRPEGWNLAVLLFATGFVNSAFMLTLAHDFSHAASRSKRFLSNLLLLILCLPFFRADHIFGHHEQVGTSCDEGSAQISQSFYDFLVRSFFQRMRRSYSHRSDMPRVHKASILRENFIFTALLTVFGASLFFIQPLLLWFWLGQSLVSYASYELTNYIQHYGLRRGPGEAVGIHHSWNSYFKYSNYILWFLPVHSPHHAEQPLRKIKSIMGPRQPFCYYKMMLLALFPWLWFRVMNPLVLKAQKRQEEVVEPAFERLSAIKHLNSHQNQKSYGTQF